MAKYATVSVKIPENLKEKMKRLGVKPSRVLRQAIEDEVKKKEVEKIKKDAVALKHTLDKISLEHIVKSVREDRDRR